MRVTVSNPEGVNEPSTPYRLRVIVHEDETGKMTFYDLEVSERGQLMRFRRWLLAVAGPLVIAVIVGLSAAGGWFFWERVQTQGEQSARTVLPKLAAKEISDIFGYDYQTVERSLARSLPVADARVSPGNSRNVLSQQIIPEAKQARGQASRPSVVGVGVMSARRTSASVMVYMNQTVTDGVCIRSTTGADFGWTSRRSATNGRSLISPRCSRPGSSVAHSDLAAVQR